MLHFFMMQNSHRWDTTLVDMYSGSMHASALTACLGTASLLASPNRLSCSCFLTSRTCMRAVGRCKDVMAACAAAVADIIILVLLNGRKPSTHGKANGCTPELGSYMERCSRPDRTSHKGSIRKRCTARNCKVRSFRCKHYFEASAHTAGESGSIENVVSLGLGDW